MSGDRIPCRKESTAYSLIITCEIESGLSVRIDDRNVIFARDRDCERFERLFVKSLGQVTMVLDLRDIGQRQRLPGRQEVEGTVRFAVGPRYETGILVATVCLSPSLMSEKMIEPDALSSALLRVRLASSDKAPPKATTVGGPAIWA